MLFALFVSDRIKYLIYTIRDCLELLIAIWFFGGFRPSEQAVYTMATVRSKHNASLKTFVSVALHNLTSLPEFTRLIDTSSSHFPHIKLDKFHTHFESSRQDFCHCQLFQLYRITGASGGSRIHRRKISWMNFNTSKLLILLLFLATMASPS